MISTFRDRSWSCWVWSGLLVSRSLFVIWQGTAGYRKCKISSGSSLLTDINFSSDFIPVWSGVCHRLGENLQILLPVAQSQGQRCLLWRNCHRPFWMAHYWHVCRALWLRCSIQVNWWVHILSVSRSRMWTRDCSLPLYRWPSEIVTTVQCDVVQEMTT